MSRPPGQRSTLESGTVPQLAHPVMRSRPAHISRDTTRRHQPPRSPRRNIEARSRGPQSRADLTNLTPYQFRDIPNAVAGDAFEQEGGGWQDLPRNESNRYRE